MPGLGPTLWLAELLLRDRQRGTAGRFPTKAQGQKGTTVLPLALQPSPGTAAFPTSSQTSAIELINVAGAEGTAVGFSAARSDTSRTREAGFAFPAHKLTATFAERCLHDCTGEQICRGGQNSRAAA